VVEGRSRLYADIDGTTLVSCRQRDATVAAVVVNVLQGRDQVRNPAETGGDAEGGEGPGAVLNENAGSANSPGRKTWEDEFKTEGVVYSKGRDRTE
jgi:hypothetical protein